MTTLLARPDNRSGCWRGGNRLPPERFPLRGPSYVRQRQFGPDPERRDRHQRERTRRAAGLAVTRGSLSHALAAVVYQLLDRCNDTLLTPAPNGEPSCSGWWGEPYIARLIYPDRYPDDNPVAGQRTAARWMAALVALGWVECIHRHRIVNGKVVGTSNLWRLRIPDELRVELHASEDAARTRKAGKHPNGRSTPRGPRNGGQQSQTGAAAARTAVLSQARQQAPCPACDSSGWVDAPPPTLGVVRCAACKGSGTARAGP